MSSGENTGITINRKPGGFLGVTSHAWMRWDAIVRVDVDVDAPRVHVSGGTWIKTRICDSGADAEAWADALFAAIERERAIELGLPLHLSPKSAAELYAAWQRTLANQSRVSMSLELGTPWPGDRFDATTMKVRADD